MTKQNSPLQELIKTDLETREFGFVWPNQDFIMKQIKSECDEIIEAAIHNEPPHRIQEEIGDLIHCVISLCLFHGFDVGETIGKTQAKFSGRINALKEVMRDRGIDSLEGLSIDQQLDMWREGKKLCYKKINA